MNFKLTISLAILLVVITSIFVYVRSRPADTTKTEEKKNALLSPAPKSITEVAYARDGQPQIAFAKTGEKWTMSYPIAGAGVENWQVDTIADRIKEATFSAKFEPEPSGVKSLSATGLDNPRNVITFTDDTGKKRKLSFGKRTVGGMYVKVDDASTIYLLDDNIVDRIDKDPADFRNKTVAEVPTDRAISMTVQTRNQKVDLKRTNGKWVITSPVPARVNMQAIDAILGELRFLRAESFTPLKPTDLATGLNPPLATVTITYEKSPDGPTPTTAPATAPATQTFTLAVGNYTDLTSKKNVYARVNDSTEVVAIEADTLNKFQKGLNDLRDPAPISSNVDTATGLTIFRADPITLAKEGDTWQLTVPIYPPTGTGQLANPVKLPADTAAVTEILTALKNIRANKFVDGAGDLKSLGLAPTVATIIITLPNQPDQEVLLIGNPQKDEPLTPVMRQGEKTVYLVRTEDLAKLSPTIIALRDKAVERIAADSIREIEITGPALTGGPISLKREGANWTANGKPADDVKVSTLVSDLSPLTVAKWLDNKPATPSLPGDVIVKLTLIQAAPNAATLPGTESVGPQPAKTETRTIRLIKKTANNATTWTGTYEGATAPAWPFEPTATLITHLTATNYAAPATQPATQSATQPTTQP